MNLEDLTFGIELEFYSSLSRNVVARRLSNAGVKTSAQNYNHRTLPHWKLTTDGSLGGGGMELVSPILKGDDGFRDITLICQTLTSLGCTLDNRCGFHVHIGVNQIPNKIPFFKRLARLYATYESEFDAMMPPSRRGNANGYCRGFKSLNLDDLDDCVNINDIVSTIGRNRYKKLNLQSYFLHGTVEFRHHSGTLSPYKIRNWVDICRHLVLTALEPQADIRPIMVAFETHEPKRRTANEFQKRARLAIINCWKTGRSFSQEMINQAIGSSTWGTVRGLLEAGSVPFTKRRIGRILYYTIEIATDSSFFDVIKMPVDLQMYVRERHETHQLA